MGEERFPAPSHGLCVVPCLSLTEQQRHLLQQQEQQLQQLQQLLASPQLTPVMPPLPRQLQLRGEGPTMGAGPGWARQARKGGRAAPGWTPAGPVGAEGVSVALRPWALQKGGSQPSEKVWRVVRPQLPRISSPSPKDGQGELQGLWLSEWTPCRPERLLWVLCWVLGSVKVSFGEKEFCLLKRRELKKKQNIIVFLETQETNSIGFLYGARWEQG